MAHRQKKYAATIKQDKLVALGHSSEGRKERMRMTSNAQWDKRIATNVRGFWKADNARA